MLLVLPRHVFPLWPRLKTMLVFPSRQNELQPKITAVPVNNVRIIPIFYASGGYVRGLSMPASLE
ncbi:hypothetical protein [Sodalis sp. C49]|uniref:hypothetical protein n=1 Tax=Sodalis sp. C49 TaxID=3228929 RepID=UPI003965D146